MGRVGALAPRLEEDGGEQASLAPAPSSSPAAVARMRAIAGTLQARSFGLFAVLSTGSDIRLIPLVVEAPDHDAEARRLHAALRRGDLTTAAMAAATPAIWLSSEAGRVAETSRWTRRIAAPAGCPDGVVFPIDAERCGAGLAAFAAPGVLTDAALCAAHMECFALFEEIARARRSALPGAPTLSKRELECLKLTADGLTSDEIATRLGLSVHTANQYLANTTQKLNAVNRMHAVAKALRAGLFD